MSEFLFSITNQAKSGIQIKKDRNYVASILSAVRVLAQKEEAFRRPSECFLDF
jgi:hypothetical protein